MDEESNSLDELGSSTLITKDSSFGAIAADLKEVSTEIIDPRFYSLTKHIDKRVILGMGTPPQALQSVPQMNFFALKAGMEFSFYIEHTEETSNNLTLDNLGKWNKRGAPSVVNRYYYDQKFRNVKKDQLYQYEILCYSSKNHSAEPIGSISRKIWKGFDYDFKPIGTAIISYSVGHDFQEFHPEIQGNTRHSERSLQRRENPPMLRNVSTPSTASQGIRKPVPRLIDGPSLKTLPLGNGEAARKRKLDQMLSPSDVLEQLFKPAETTQTEKLFQGHTFADYSDEEPSNGFDEEESEESPFAPKQEALDGLDASDTVEMVSSDIVDFDFYGSLKDVPTEILIGKKKPPQCLSKVPNLRTSALKPNMSFSFYIEHNKETTGILTYDNLGYWSRRHFPSLMNRFYFDDNFKKMMYISQNHSHFPVGSLKRRIWKCFDSDGVPIGTAIVSYSTNEDFQSNGEMMQRNGKFDLVTAGNEKPSSSFAGSPDTRMFPALMDSKSIGQAAKTDRLQFYCWLCPLTKAGKVGYDFKESLQMHFHRHHSKEEFKEGIDKLLDKPTTSRTTPSRNKRTVRPSQASLLKLQPVDRQAESSMKILKSSTFRSLPYQPQSSTSTLRNQLKFKLSKLYPKIHQTATFLMNTDLNQAANYIAGLEMMANLDEGESSTTGGQFAKNEDLFDMGILGMKQDTSSENDDRQGLFRSCSICLQTLPDDLTVPVEWLKCEECHGWTHKSCREADLPCPSCLRGLLKAETSNEDQNFVQVKDEIDN
ncbi:unnamed protein product, partial [Mesorhabditis belari]|uniref:Uncharacterized protein n=1 Tax=Mesorhabditis belari TaxID=2138241 RepID=A0AAF3ETQ6_9BILA